MRRLYVTCPVCNEEIQEDTTLFVDKHDAIVGCDLCMNTYNADIYFNFWEDDDEELYRIADDENDIARWEREMNNE